MSAVGTIPENEDKRPQDILADKQIRRAAVDPGTFADTLKPPLPQIPSISQPNIQDLVKDFSTAVFRDLLKNVTINGQSPEVSGKTISFEIATQPAASTQFAQLNPSVQPPLPVQPTSAPVSPEAPEARKRTPAVSLQEMEASSIERNTPKTSAARNEEAMDATVRKRIENNPEYRPSSLASNEEKESFKRVINNAPADPVLPPRQPISPQLQQQFIASVTPGATGNNWLAIDKKSSDWDAEANRPVYGKPENRQPGESRPDQVTREDKEYQQQKSEHKKKEEIQTEDQPGKRKGEGEKHYTERMNEERRDSMTDAQATAVQNGDTSYFNKGFIPILFTRKDGLRKILARLDNTHSAVIEGAVSGERVGDLPAENAYYLGGGEGGSSCNGLQLSTKVTGTGANTHTVVIVTFGSVAGSIINEYEVASSGSGSIYANVYMDEVTGQVETGWVDSDTGGATVSLTLGTYAYSGDSVNVSNSGCGSIYANVCRNWFAAEAPFFSCTLTRG